MTTKETVLAVLERLPDDCTIEDVQYQLYVTQAIAAGQADAEAGRVVPTNSLKPNCDASGWSGPTSSVGCVGVSVARRSRRVHSQNVSTERPAGTFRYPGSRRALVAPRRTRPTGARAIPSADLRTVCSRISVDVPADRDPGNHRRIRPRPAELCVRRGCRGRGLTRHAADSGACQNERRCG